MSIDRVRWYWAASMSEVEWRDRCRPVRESNLSVRVLALCCRGKERWHIKDGWEKEIDGNLVWRVKWSPMRIDGSWQTFRIDMIIVLPVSSSKIRWSISMGKVRSVAASSWDLSVELFHVECLVSMNVCCSAHAFKWEGADRRRHV